MATFFTSTWWPSDGMNFMPGSDRLWVSRSLATNTSSQGMKASSHTAMASISSNRVASGVS